MSNTARAVTRPRRANPGWQHRTRLTAADLRPVNWRTPPPGRPLPHFQVTRPAPKRRGAPASPISTRRRLANYARQNGAPETPLRPGQNRRAIKKHHRELREAAQWREATQ